MQEFLETIMNHKALEIPPLTVVLRLGISFILILIMSLLYKKLNREKENCHIIMHSMIYLGVLVTGAMIVIGSNLVVAFGLLGAVSIIRFRTIIDNAIDMTHIVLSVIIGISSGLGFISHAVILSAFLGLLMVLLNKLQIGMKPPTKFPFRISITINKKLADPEMRILLRERLGKDSVLLSVESTKANVELRFRKAISGLEEAAEIYRTIEDLFNGHESLKIRIDRKKPKDFR